MPATTYGRLVESLLAALWIACIVFAFLTLSGLLRIFCLFALVMIERLTWPHRRSTG